MIQKGSHKVHNNFYKPKSQAFFMETTERMRWDLMLRRDAIGRRICESSCGIYGLEKYTGIINQLGCSTCENTTLAAEQFNFTLAMSSHPSIDQLIMDESITPGTFDPEPLMEEGVLKGMKILDLGCGHLPTFARCVRHFGAEVYTLDMIPASDLEAVTYFQECRELEMRNHIRLNLERRDATEKISEISGGEFDLTTEAHLSTDGFSKGREIALPLLKQGGIHYIAGRTGVEVYVKEGDSYIPLD